MKTKFSELKMRQIFGLKKDELNLIRCKEFDIPSMYGNGYPSTRVNSQQLDGRFSRQGYWFISPDTVVYTFGQLYEKYGQDIVGVHVLAPGQKRLFKYKSPDEVDL